MSGEHIACVLASGKSTRFGSDNKLLADVNGQPMITHVITALRQANYETIMVIVPAMDEAVRAKIKAPKIQVIDNPDADKGQSSSLKLAADYADKIQANSLMIALGDMPFVPADHFKNLRAEIDHHTALVSSGGERLCPPAIFDQSCFKHFQTLSGDRGARMIFDQLDNTKTLKTNPQYLRDIDHPEDLLC